MFNCSDWFRIKQWIEREKNEHFLSTLTQLFSRYDDSKQFHFLSCERVELE